MAFARSEYNKDIVEIGEKKEVWLALHAVWECKREIHSGEEEANSMRVLARSTIYNLIIFNVSVSRMKAWETRAKNQTKEFFDKSETHNKMNFLSIYLANLYTQTF